MKTCSKCGIEKPLSQFHKDKYASGGVRTNCKACYAKFHAEYYKANTEKVKLKNRRAWLQRKYGMTLEAYDLIHKSQKGCCAICKKDLDTGYLAHVDHDHKDGTIRGILCRWCNTGLGNFKDSQENLKSAAAYLKKHQK